MMKARILLLILFSARCCGFRSHWTPIPVEAGHVAGCDVARSYARTQFPRAGVYGENDECQQLSKALFTNRKKANFYPDALFIAAAGFLLLDRRARHTSVRTKLSNHLTYSPPPCATVLLVMVP